MSNPLSPNGRMRPLPYAAASAALIAAYLIARGRFGGPGVSSVSVVMIGLAVSLGLFLVSTRRLHDAGRNSYMAIGILMTSLCATAFGVLHSSVQGPARDSAAAVTGILMVSLVVLVSIAAVLRGDFGPNRFGPDPREGAIPEKAPPLEEMTARDVAEHPEVLPAHANA